MMPKLMILVLSFLASLSALAQDYTINGHKSNALYIGVDNNLIIDSHVNIRRMFSNSHSIRMKTNKDHFRIIALYPEDTIEVYVLYENNNLDTLFFSVSHLQFRQYIMTQSGNGIIAGEYPKQLLLEMDSVVIDFNAPFISSNIVGMRILIQNKDKVLYDEINYGGNLRKKEIITAIDKLERGGIIKLYDIHAKLPYDDGNRPKDMILICK